jgi:hypothetical protein
MQNILRDTFSKSSFYKDTCLCNLVNVFSDGGSLPKSTVSVVAPRRLFIFSIISCGILFNIVSTMGLEECQKSKFSHLAHLMLFRDHYLLVSVCPITVEMTCTDVKTSSSNSSASVFSDISLAILKYALLSF